MLLWTTLGLFVVGILLFNIGGRLRSSRCENAGAGMTVIFGALLLFMVVAIGIEYIGADAEFTKHNEHQGFLVVQYKTGIYDNSVYSQYNLLQQIDEWNCTLAEKQKLTHDYWVGVFVPDYWDDLDYITVNLFGDVTGGGDR